MSRIVYCKANPEHRFGFAFRVKNDSHITDDTPLGDVNAYVMQALQGVPANVPQSWLLGGWFQCDRCDECILCSMNQPSCNAGISAPLTPGAKGEPIPVRYYCRKCSDEVKRQYAAAADVSRERARIAGRTGIRC